MRIGIDAGCWANDRGYGRFTREILRALVAVAPEEEFHFFLDPASQASFELHAPNVFPVAVRQSVSPTEAAGAEGNRSLRDMLRFSRAVAGRRLDVFFAPSVYTYFPLPPGLPALIGIHDAIADRFPLLTLPSRRARLFWRVKVKLALWQARLVLSVSEYAADQVSSVLNVPRSRIRVAVEAPSGIYRPSDDPAEVASVAARYGLPAGSKWFMYVGGFNPHKRLDTLVEAFASLLAGFGAGEEEPYLVLVGKTTGDVFHRNTAEIRQAINTAGLEDRVVWAGYVADDELRHLHSGAIALVLPSESEGFGLPAVESAACGTPVIATTESPLPLLLEGGGVFVAPGDPAALTAAMRHLLNDEVRQRAGVRALAQARLLSWENCARAALAAIRETAA